METKSRYCWWKCVKDDNNKLAFSDAAKKIAWKQHYQCLLKIEFPWDHHSSHQCKVLIIVQYSFCNNFPSVVRVSVPELRILQLHHFNLQILQLHFTTFSFASQFWTHFASFFASCKMQTVNLNSAAELTAGLWPYTPSHIDLSSTWKMKRGI